MRERAHGENWRGSLTLTEPPFRSSLRGGPYPRPHVAIGTGQPQPSSRSNSRPRTGSLHCPPLRAHSRAPLRAGEEATPPPPGAPVNAPRARVWSWPLVPHPTCPSPTQRRAPSRRLEWRHPADGGGVGGRSGSAQGPAPLPVPLDGSAPGLAPEPGCPPLGDGDSSPHVSTHARRIPTRDRPRGSGPRQPARRDTCARGARPSPLGAEHGLPHPAAGSRASAAGPPAAAWPRQLSPPRADFGAPRPRTGPHRSGLRPGAAGALTALRRRRRAARPAAEGRPLGALRPRPRSARAPAPPRGRRGHCTGPTPRPPPGPLRARDRGAALREARWDHTGLQGRRRVSQRGGRTSRTQCLCYKMQP